MTANEPYGVHRPKNVGWNNGSHEWADEFTLESVSIRGIRGGEAHRASFDFRDTAAALPRFAVERAGGEADEDSPTTWTRTWTRTWTWSDAREIEHPFAN